MPQPSSDAAVWQAHVRAQLALWAKDGRVTSRNYRQVVTLYNQVFAQAAQAIGHPPRPPYTRKVNCFGCASRTPQGRAQLAELDTLLTDLIQFADGN